MDTSQSAEQPWPWHAGERDIQHRAGVADRMEAAGRQIVHRAMPGPHRAFYAQLPFLLLGTVDADGAAWASILEDEPGFARSPTPQTLRIAALPGAGDPAFAAMTKGSAVAVLGIDLRSRRRSRLNGIATTVGRHGFTVAVEHAFGNCPQYIQTRDFGFIRSPATTSAIRAESIAKLDDAARATIAAADTFFVASYVDIDGDSARRQVDISHRGGKPGFVRIEGNTLTIPDFAGNLHFNTLGNLAVNPRAGLLFIDFASGDTLQLTGTTEIVLAGDEIRAFQGAERLWRVHVERVVRRTDALALRFVFGDYSPNVLLTGSWHESAARLAAESQRRRWRPFKVTRIEQESANIRSLHLVPADGGGAAISQAGQHLPLRVSIPGEVAPSVRTYTLSSAPSDPDYRISIKRHGKASNFLHDHVLVGDTIEARAPDGAFTVDSNETRPVVLLSAGVGITPMVSMLRHLIYEGQRTRTMRRTYFVHGSRTAAERPFAPELGVLAAAAGDSLTVVQVLSHPESHLNTGIDYDIEGRIDVTLLKDLLGFDDYDFYLCGPAEFMQGVYGQLRDLRVPDERIHAEAFGPAKIRRRPDMATATEVQLPAATRPVHVTFAKSGKEARWLPGSGTLLELAEAQGVNPEFSCRGGTCGTCRTAIREGQVAYTLTPDAAHAAGEVLICCAVPAGGSCDEGKIVLDL